MASENVKKEKVEKSPVALREEEILAFWDKNQIFQKTLQKDSPKGEFTFYDGPPFATGLPHYGHILASTIKDAVPRYQTMRGYHIDRRWGWDCHGLPVENIVEKDLGVSGKKQIEAIGVEKFNEHARGQVLGFVHDWKKTIERIGRWVNFEGSYKTMDNSYMESVWWALKEMYKKGLVYESTKVLAYCPRCETPIANSEIAMDGSYRDITDISVYVKLELSAGEYVLAWTTTPWTLPGNFALAINSKISYVKVKAASPEGKEEIYWLAEDRVSQVFGTKPVEVLEKVKGSELVGRSYKPIFDYFVNSPLIPSDIRDHAWKIYAADFVTIESGTGVVHIAPGYGEDDLALAHKEGIPFAHHVQGDGRFMPIVKDFAGLSVKPKPEKTGDHQSTDIEIIKYLAHNGFLFAKEKIVHPYPHCYRCDTPLFYYAIPSWFVKITEVKQKLLDLNEKINWVPEHLKEGRFKKSMEGAPDWTISRNRYWASPLPIWKCENTGEVEFIGSLEELKARTHRNNYVVMRHGEADQNVKRVMVSSVETPCNLTKNGEEQVRLSAKKLKEKKIDLIISSPLARTRETAELVAKELGLSVEVIIDERLHEESFGDLEGKSIEEYRSFYKKPEDRLEKSVPNGENLLDMRQRVGSFLYEIDKKYEGKNILIITHDGVAKMIKAVKAGALKDQLLNFWDGPDDLLNTGSFMDLDFAFIPHNKNYELDLHRPYIDEVLLPSKNGPMKRIPEVIDCWFESGSMPFAANHYPFENKDVFKKAFPADFVSEYIAQTRTWFYYMHAVSTILFDSIPFKNVVTTGTVLAEDGQKMSKSKGNFTDPTILLDKFGADSVRLYLLSSPLMKAEDLNFSEKSVDDIYKKVVMRLGNVVSFYQIYADEKNIQEPLDENFASENILDKWIVARLQQIGIEMSDGLESYQLDKSSRPIFDFVDDFSTWYLRRSRDRFKGEDAADKKAALATMRYVLREFATLLAPFTPFIAEDIYLKVKAERDPESVHLQSWPVFEKADEKILAAMIVARKIVENALALRAEAGLKVRQPIASITVYEKEWTELLKSNTGLASVITDEINAKEIKFGAGKVQTDKVVGAEQVVDRGIYIDTELTPELREEMKLRELVRAIQDIRKDMKFSPHDKAKMTYAGDENVVAFVTKYSDELIKKTNLGSAPALVAGAVSVSVSIEDLKFSVLLEKV